MHLLTCYFVVTIESESAKSPPGKTELKRESEREDFYDCFDTNGSCLIRDGVQWKEKVSNDGDLNHVKKMVKV